MSTDADLPALPELPVPVATYGAGRGYYIDKQMREFASAALTSQAEKHAAELAEQRAATHTWENEAERRSRRYEVDVAALRAELAKLRQGEPALDHAAAIRVLTEHAMALDKMSRPARNTVTQATAESTAAEAAAVRRSITSLQESPTCDECGKTKADGRALYCVKCAEMAFGSHPTAQPAGEPLAPNNDEVICPNCAHQFRAIPVHVQEMLLAAGYEPPFYASPPPAQPPREALQPLLEKALAALQLASTICDRVPTRAHLLPPGLVNGDALRDLGFLVNAQPDGTHGYRVIAEAENEVRAEVERLITERMSAAKETK